MSRFKVENMRSYPGKELSAGRSPVAYSPTGAGTAAGPDYNKHGRAGMGDGDN